MPNHTVNGGKTSSQTPRPITVRFVSRDKRNEIMTNRHRIRQADLKKFSVAGTNGIHINENLTHYREKLFWQAKQNPMNTSSFELSTSYPIFCSIELSTLSKKSDKEFLKRDLEHFHNKIFCENLHESLHNFFIKTGVVNCHNFNEFFAGFIKIIEKAIDLHASFKKLSRKTVPKLASPNPPTGRAHTKRGPRK